MSNPKKPLPYLHAVQGGVQMPVVSAADDTATFINGFRGDLPFLHAITADGQAIMPVVKVIGEGSGPGPNPSSKLEAGNGIKLTQDGDNTIVSTVVPISKKGSPGKHRYWRWDLPATVDPASENLQVTKIRLTGADGVDFLTAGMPVTASKDITTGKATNAFTDGVSSSTWTTGEAAPAWVYVDFGANPVEPVSSYIVRRTAAIGNMPSKATISFSDDAVTWTEAGSFDLIYRSDARTQDLLLGTVDVPAFIGEAPNDNKSYVRKNEDWVVAPEGGALDVPSLPAAGAAERGDLLPVSQSLNPAGESWRVRILRSMTAENLSSTGAVYVYEMEFRESAGGTKHPNGTLISSGVSSGANAFDGNLNNNVSSTAGAGAAILGQSYGSAKKVNELAIYCPSSSTVKNKFPAVFFLERRAQPADAWEVVETFDLIAAGVTVDDLPDGGWMTFDATGSDSTNLRAMTLERLAAFIKEENPEQVTEAGDGIKVDATDPGAIIVSTLVPISRKGPPGKHRFWRWTFPDNYGDDQFRLQKLRMFDGAGQRIELDATNTTVTASNQDGGSSASNAIYNAATGFWATARFVTFPVWVATEFTTPLEVTSVTLARNETLTSTRPRSLMVEFSDDGLTWTQALGVTTLTWAGGDTAAVPMGDTDIPAFPPYPPKDGKSYVMKDEEWLEYTAPESGTWTPTITTDAASDLTATYTNQSGVYTKVGSLVTVTGRLAFTPDFTGTPGALRIAGLPFTSRSQSGVVSVGNIVGANVDLPEGASIIVGATGHSSNFIGLITSTSGGPFQTLNAETSLETGRASELRFSISYEV